MKLIPRLIALTLVAYCSATLAQSDDTVTVEASADEVNSSSLATREERLAEKPVDWNEARGAGLRTDAVQEPETVTESDAPAGESTGGRPDKAADEDARQAFPDEWAGLEESRSIEDLDPEGEVGTLGTKDTFAQYCENCDAVNKDFPQRTIGKLFTSAGTCTASVISRNNVVVTAAHCCYNRSAGQFNSNFRFAPAYRDGFAPYGMFNYSSATVLGRWLSVGDRKSDVCVIKLRNNAQRRPVTHYTGWLGRSWNRSTTQLHHAVGYPGNIGGGNKKQICVSESFNPSSSCGGASVLNTGCSMTFGASGGPWIRGYRSYNKVNSVVSGYDGTSCTGSFGKTFNGPRFTSDNIVKVCNAIGC